MMFGQMPECRWVTQLLARRPFKVVAVALANKMARTAWALMVHGGTYRAPGACGAAEGLARKRRGEFDGDR